jgi:PAS domain S-box-containing protein
MKPIFDIKPPQQITWKGKAPGAAEFQSLFYLYPFPALVIDNRSDFILAANPEFLKFSGYSTSDLQNRELSTLLPNTSRFSIDTRRPINAYLKRYSGELLDVTITSRSLDESAARVILQFEQTDTASLRNTSQRDPQSPAVVGLLLNTLTASTLNEALENFLVIADGLLPARIKCIYRLNNHHRTLEKSISREGASPLFPDIIPLDNLDSREAITWLPGKRVTDEFSRVARAADLSCLVNYPLLMADTRLGNLILSDTSPINITELNFRGSILAKYLEVILYHFTIRETLENAFQQHLRDLSFRDMVIQHANEGIILLKRDLSIEEINPAAENILGYASREISGESAENIIIGTDELLPALNKARQGQPTVNFGEVHLHRRNGESFLAFMQTYPVILDEVVQGVILLIRDESEQEQIRLNSQHMEQQAILGRLTAVMAHEIRNPINNISAGVQMINRTLPADDSNRTYLAMMLEDLARLTHLMESVLQFSKFNEYRIVPSDLANLFRRIFDRYGPRFTNANIKAILDIDPNCRQALCDLRAMESVFTNIINNAIAVMPNGGALAVKMVNLPDSSSIPEVEVTISDTGPGIPEELREHIFEPFVSHTQGGTGLGLALTKSIVSAHKGAITVESFPGGTVFHVTLLALKNPGGK